MLEHLRKLRAVMLLRPLLLCRSSLSHLLLLCRSSLMDLMNRGCLSLL